MLHFVSLPPDSDESAESSFILASRLPILGSQNAPSGDGSAGVQRILVLPTANKACILCNGVVTFYTLPELSPTYGTTKVGNCKWIGGFDLNESLEDDTGEDPIIMVAVNSRIMLVRIGEEPRRVRNIEFPDCVAGARRGSIACVADTYSYSLLEVEHRQKISLFPISSSAESFDSGQVEDIPARIGTPILGNLSASYSSTPPSDNGAHSRSASLNTIASGFERRQQNSPSRVAERSSPSPAVAPESSAAHSGIGPQKGHGSTQTPEPSAAQTGTTAPTNQKPLPLPPKQPKRLCPNIVSPNQSEFLLVTGTESSEPGVGMFVNLDGELTRSTVEFRRYPDAIIVDSSDEGSPGQNDKESYILAVIRAEGSADSRPFIEAQQWDTGLDGEDRPKSVIEIPSDQPEKMYTAGMSRTISSSHMVFADISDVMRMVRLKTSVPGSPSFPSTPRDSPDPRTRASIEHLQKEKELFDSQELDSEISKQPTVGLRRGWENERNREETEFARTLGKVSSNTVLWSGNRIWRVLRNPLALQLDNALRLAEPMKEADQGMTDRDAIVSFIDGLRNMEPKTETEFLGLNYVRQKASLLLFRDLLASTNSSDRMNLVEVTESALEFGGLDPRIMLLLVPFLKEEVLQSPQGIWINSGIASILDQLLGHKVGNGTRSLSYGGIDESVLYMLKRYLQSWQKKRGYGSVADETYVFNSIDAALLHLLLELNSKEKHSDTAAPSSTRMELYMLVDNWKGDFERAVELLESYQRMFVLSRLYQSRKMAKQVLATWRRIVEGEEDKGGDLTSSAVDMQVRKYLVRIRDVQLVEDYGSWLASRNPELGVQVFADDSSRVKLDPPHVVELLKARAPGSVQEYLEYLVFTKNVSHPISSLVFNN